MPKVSIPIKKDYPSQSVIDMAETLGRLTGTVVESQVVLEITANEFVIKALQAIAPMAKGKKAKGEKRKYNKRQTRAEKEETVYTGKDWERTPA